MLKSKMAFFGDSSSTSNPLASNLYEDEEHPWGPPPVAPSVPPRDSSFTASTSADELHTASGEGAGSSAFGTGFEDPYVASPFARQPSHSHTNTNIHSQGSKLLQEPDQRQDSLFGGGFAQERHVDQEDGHGFANGAMPPPTPGKSEPQPQPSAFGTRTFQSHTPSSMLPSPTGASAQFAQQGQQLTPGYPMPQSYSSPVASYSPFARVDSLNTRKEAVEDMYGVPENFLEVEVRNPMTHGTSAVVPGGSPNPPRSQALVVRCTLTMKS